VHKDDGDRSFQIAVGDLSAQTVVAAFEGRKTTGMPTVVRAVCRMSGAATARFRESRPFAGDVRADWRGAVSSLAGLTMAAALAASLRAQYLSRWFLLADDGCGRLRSSARAFTIRDRVLYRRGSDGTVFEGAFGWMDSARVDECVRRLDTMLPLFESDSALFFQDAERALEGEDVVLQGAVTIRVVEPDREGWLAEVRPGSAVDKGDGRPQFDDTLLAHCALVAWMQNCSRLFIADPLCGARAELRPSDDLAIHLEKLARTIVAAGAGRRSGPPSNDELVGRLALS
jgi:hypothetical protein